MRDTTISYDGGVRRSECLPQIPHFVDEWADREGLELANLTTSLGADVNVYAYGPGINYGIVTHVQETLLNHDWPSTVANADNSLAGRSVASFNATPVIIEFSMQHPLDLNISG